MATTTTFATAKKPAEKTLIINANVFNGKSKQLAEGISVLVEGNKITKIAKSIEALKIAIFRVKNRIIDRS